MSSTNQSLKRLKTGRFVSNNHVRTLRKNYQAKRWVENSKRIGKPDTTNIWYGLNDLRYFLDEAEKSGADGVNFYFGVYPSSLPEDPAREGRQTIVLVATKEVTNSDGEIKNEDLYVAGPEGPTMIAFNMSGAGYPRPTGIPGQDLIFEEFPFLKPKQQLA